MRWCCPLFLVFVVTGVCPQGLGTEVGGESGQFAILVWERSGVPREDEPVSVGIPLPRGHSRSVERVVLLDRQGAGVACQATPLARWPDGSVKWALLDFVATVPANARVRYHMRYGPDAHPRPPEVKLRIEEKDSGYLVNTGAMFLEIPKDRGLFYRDVHLVDDTGAELFCRGGAEAATTSYFLRHYFTSDDRAEMGHKAELVRSGPLHAVFKTSGRHRLEMDADRMAHFAFETRLHVYAGQRFLRLFYTFINTTDADPSCVSGVGVRVPVPQDARRYAFGLSGTVPSPDEWLRAYVSSLPAGLVREGTLAADQTITLGQQGPTAGLAHAPFQAVWRERSGEWRQAGSWHHEGVRLPGWVDYGNGRVGVTVAVRDFWQLHPKSLSVRGPQAALGTRGYPYPYAYKDHVDEERAAVGIGLVPTQIGDGLIFTVGAAKTHELLLHFHRGDHREARSIHRAAAFQNPLRAVVDPEWICKTGVFGDLTPVDPSAFPRYERLVREGFGWFEGEAERLKEYGMMDFGDCLTGAAYNSWTNLEYDLHRALILLYARSGDPAYFDRAERAARHFMDVDVLHYYPHPAPPSPWRHRGMVYKHRYFHVGRRSCERPAPKLDHSWNEGLFDYYYLTGDDRALQVALETAEFFVWAAENISWTIKSQQERAMGWPIIGLVASYRATGDQRYLGAANLIVELSLQRQNEQLGAWRSYTDEQGRARWTSKPFMVGILMEGLRAYHEETNDERVAKSIVSGSRWLIRHAKETGEPIDERALEGLAYAFKLTGDRAFAEAAAEAFDLALAEREAGPWRPNEKAVATFTRSTPHVLPVLAEAGVWKTGRPAVSSSQP